MFGLSKLFIKRNDAAVLNGIASDFYWKTTKKRHKKLDKEIKALVKAMKATAKKYGYRTYVKTYDMSKEDSVYVADVLRDKFDFSVNVDSDCFDSQFTFSIRF